MMVAGISAVWIRVGLASIVALCLGTHALAQTGAPGTPPTSPPGRTNVAPTVRLVPLVSSPTSAVVSPVPVAPALVPATGMPAGNEKSRNLIALRPTFSSNYEYGEVLAAWTDEKRYLMDYQALAPYKGFEIEPENLSALGLRVLRYRFPNEVEALEFRDLLASRFPNALVERNWRYGALGTPQHYAAQRLGLPKGTPKTRVAIRIGMLDTAVRPIAALSGSTLVQRSFSGSEPVASADHGTAVASLMLGRDDAAGFYGPAYGASLFVGSVMRVQRNQSGTTTAMLLSGLDWLLSNQVNVVNLSVGGLGDTLLRWAVERCLQRGIALVAAAGNGGPNAAPVFPAAYPGVIAVTATDANNAAYAGANQGDYISLSAPGVEVWAPAEVGGAYRTGTSFAAAVVSGVLARQQSLHMLAPLQAATRLCATALDLGPAGRDPQFGCGLVQWTSGN